MPPYYTRAVRILATISLGLAISTHAVEPPAVLLERALHLETVEGNAAEAARIYSSIIESPGPPTRARAEAAFQLAAMRAAESKFAEAKALYFRVIRDFPEAPELNSLAEDELLKMVAIITREQVTANPAAPHRLGDLAVSLLGALENEEASRATAILEHMDATLGAIGGSVAIFAQLRTQRKDLETALKEQGPAVALVKMRRSVEFEPFINRAFPAEPNDVLAPVWRLKDRLARALAANDAPGAESAAAQLQDYLAPIASLPVSIPEGSLARLISEAMKEIRAAVEAGKFADARTRLDTLDDARHDQFPGQRIATPSGVRLPENALATGWAVIFRAELARREINQKAHAVAMDHIQEGMNACKVALSLVEDPAITVRLQAQMEALRAAYSAVEKNLLAVALHSLRKVAGQ
jgi:hypothetical protein